jgi:hypothetical protein
MGFYYGAAPIFPSEFNRIRKTIEVYYEPVKIPVWFKILLVFMTKEEKSEYLEKIRRINKTRIRAAIEKGQAENKGFIVKAFDIKEKGKI